MTEAPAWQRNDPVIPREGVESMTRALQNLIPIEQCVIPREGVESRAKINDRERDYFSSVIPKEGVESLRPRRVNVRSGAQRCDPERGS